MNIEHLNVGERYLPTGIDYGYKLATKFVQNRLFRKGDRVKPRERNGRSPWAKDSTLTVVADESSAGVTVRCDETGEERLMCVLFLELVLPVEEQEPYSVGESTDFFCVEDKDGNEISFYWKDTHPNPKAAAENERDRLNSEWKRTPTETKTPFDA